MDLADRATPAALIAVDWGTSSLRAWGVSASGEVVAERRSDEGMARLQPADFEPALRRSLAGIAHAPGVLPVVACGMAGARQGWREAGYVDVPADIATLCSQALAVPADGLDVRILPGLASRGAAEDVMRGEETQLLGLLQAEPALSGLACLPGTHSKWVRLEAGRVMSFRTAMTGEMFELLSEHSVLRHSLAGARPSGDPDAPGFVRGLRQGLAAPARLLASLFAVRAASLLRGVVGTEAADTLSGLLIGAEIGGAPAASNAPAATGAQVTLLADGALARLYGKGLALAGWPARLVDARSATQRGLIHAADQLWPRWRDPA